MSMTEHRRLQVAAFDQIGDRYDEAFPHRAGQVAAGEWLAVQLTPGSRVLDVGCGTGLPTARNLVDAGMHVTGIDISSVMLELARRNVPEGDFRLLDAVDITSDLGEFDGAAAFFSLLMLPRAEIPAVLAAIRQTMRPRAPLALAMVEADMDDVPISFLDVPVRVTGYPRDQLREVVAAAGFTVLEEHVLEYAPATSEAPPEIQLVLYCRGNG